MTVGALCDLGAQPSALEWELGKLELGEYHAHFEKASRQTIHGIQFSVHDEVTHQHEHHEHEHHGHKHHGHEHGRSYAEIRELIAASALSDFVKQHAHGIFHRIAVAEGKIHGVPAEQVGFHEVGALDSIADVVCVCAALELLGKPRVLVGPLREGRGWIDCAHGRFPLPAPATAEILQGWALEQTDEPFESITPTGAAIVAEFAQSSPLMPPMRIERIGYGIGSRDLPQRPNVLRAILGETSEFPAASFATDTVIELETNLDDISAELLGAAVEHLTAAGALDVTLAPLQMKKNRPGVRLSILCHAADESRLVELVLTETSAFGLRRSQKRRYKLDRRFAQVPTPFGEITVKLGLHGSRVVQVAPEFESCRVASERTGEPLRVIYQAAMAAAPLA